MDNRLKTDKELSFPKKLGIAVIVLACCAVFVFSDKVIVIAMLISYIVLTRFLNRKNKEYGMSILSIAQSISIITSNFVSCMKVHDKAVWIAFVGVLLICIAVSALAILCYVTKKKSWIIMLLIAQILCLIMDAASTVFGTAVGKVHWIRLVLHPLIRIVILYQIVRYFKGDIQNEEPANVSDEKLWEKVSVPQCHSETDGE